MDTPVDAKLKIKRRITAYGYKAKMGFLFGRSFNVSKLAVVVGTLLVATLAAPALNRQLVLHAAPPPVGKADAGNAFWQGQMCQYCHGVEAEGAWGPDLAGRGLSEAQIKHALRQPYGLMPAYTESQVSEQTIADLQAFFSTLPKAEQFGPWRWQNPPRMGPPNEWGVSSEVRNMRGKALSALSLRKE